MRVIIAAILAGGLSLAALWGADKYLGIGGAAPAPQEAEDAADAADDAVDEDENGFITEDFEDVIDEPVEEFFEEEAAPDEETAGRFINTAETDYHGYYMPNALIQTGDWVLRHIHIGHASQFEAFEDSGQDRDLIPVWIEFMHADAEMLTTEEGFEYPSESRRVRADRFHIGETSFEFEASYDEIGDVYVYGTLDPEQIQGPVEGSTGIPALTGGAELNGERLHDISFDHWYGH